MSDGGAFGFIGGHFAPFPKSPITLASLPSDHSSSSIEPEAALYLANHVAKVKLEAAEADYNWSQRVNTLQSQNRQLTQQVQKLERVVKENSLQWRLRERDDWKNLVAAVQRDRDRLETENTHLTSKVSLLKRQLVSAGVQPNELASTDATPTGSSIAPSTTSLTSTSTPTTPTTSTTSTTSSTLPTPTALATPTLHKSTADVPHPNADNVPQATMMRFKELEAQLAESLTREDFLRHKLQTCEGELQLWRVEKQADFNDTVQSLQRKLNLELEQKWARNRGFRPLQDPFSPNKRAPSGIISRLVEVVAPYPSVEQEFDEKMNL